MSMPMTFAVLTFLSAAAFVGYGVACLITDHMEAEFTRFGLARFRALVGTLELLGGLGLAVGWFYRPLLILSAGGLTILMLLGVWTRLRLRDSAAETAPAALFLGVNAFVLWCAIG